MAKIITTEEFETEVVKAEHPVLVDFFATWCGPCKMMSPVLEEVTNEVKGKGSVVKVDVDQSPELAVRFKVMSVPTLILFEKGEAVKQFVGVQSKQVLLDLF